ncbi:MAG TPA: DUF2218 domain-containing protein [Stellaceae bacterium]|nr:DUF2218 domain-containing protein [Stellaceae bacterium]
MEAAVRAEARVVTTRAERYLIQLCKHFEHRLPVVRAGAEGSITFPSGTCHMTADGDLLVLGAHAKDDTLLDQLEQVVSRHLERFAFRDKPEIAWRRLSA